MSPYRLKQETVKKKNIISLISDLRCTINHIIYINAYLHYILAGQVGAPPKFMSTWSFRMTIFGNRLFADILSYKEIILDNNGP